MGIRARVDVCKACFEWSDMRLDMRKGEKTEKNSETLTCEYFQTCQGEEERQCALPQDSRIRLRSDAFDVRIQSEAHRRSTLQTLESGW